MNWFYKQFGKRSLDVALALGTAIVLFPLIVLVGLLIRWRMGSPVIFSQGRAGTNGIPFTMYKFRTMQDLVDPSGVLLPDEQRLTRVGRFLRQMSLDELPQVWNVIRGDMSLVGPRPLLTEYLSRYTLRQARRHEVRPGVTGWAQVMGRNAITWEERFELDVWYVDNLNLGVDLRIFWLTLVNVFLRKDVNASGYATMPKFMGSKSTE